MAAVKGSKQLKMVVVPHRPVRALWLVGAALAFLFLVAVGGWQLGHYRAVSSNGDARAERDALRLQVSELENSNAQLRQQNLSLEQAATLDKEALSSVQRTIVTLREQISQLEEDVLFYKQILAPVNEDAGLVIGKLDLVQSDGSSAVRFKLELKQQGNNESLLSGYVNVNVVGLQNGEEVSIPLQGLSDSVDDLDIRLQFRYFQNIEGELRLPADFEPQKVHILAVAEGASAKTVQKSFGWLVQN
jgi:hypothetical protein